MKVLSRFAAVAAVGIATAAAFAGPASAATARHAGPRFGGGASHVVFVQTDNTAGNQVVAYDRAGDGALTLARTYDTDGLGGILSGSVVDHLASQGSLTYDPDNDLLFAVNAGSNTISVFSVRGDRLWLTQVIGSGGAFPVSVAVHGDLVYVLNAENGGSVQGYRILFGHVWPIWSSNRPLGLDPTATPQFTNTPGQVAFSPDGSQLIVTTKANGNDIDVFSVRWDGSLSRSARVNSEPGTVPFAISFDQAGHLVIAEAGTNALATFALSSERHDRRCSTRSAPARRPPAGWPGSAAPSTPRTPGAPRERVPDRRRRAAHVARPDRHGRREPSTRPARPAGSSSTCRPAASGIVDEFQVNSDASLTEIGRVTVANAVGGEGIVAF